MDHIFGDHKSVIINLNQSGSNHIAISEKRHQSVDGNSCCLIHITYVGTTIGKKGTQVIKPLGRTIVNPHQKKRLVDILFLVFFLAFCKSAPIPPPENIPPCFSKRDTMLAIQEHVQWLKDHKNTIKNTTPYDTSYQDMDHIDEWIDHLSIMYQF
jgi:hypothetical protein